MYIFDGYNFIHKIPELRRAIDEGPQQGRRALASYLVDLAPRLGVKLSQFLVVYDGNIKYDDMPGEQGPVKTVFSRGGDSGDDRVIGCVRQARDAGAVIVVSDDNMIANNVRVYGAKVLRARELLALVEKRRRSRKGARVKGEKESKVIRNAAAITKQLAREWEVE